MTTFQKGLRRPQCIADVPMIPLIVTFGFIIIVSIWTSYALLLLLPVDFFILKRLAKWDIHFFSILASHFRTRGNPVANRYYDAKAISSVPYEPVDITEFVDSMKLNQQTNIEKHIPYSSHVGNYIVRGKDGSLFSTWEVIGSAFDCESEDAIEAVTSQLNQLYRSFEGQPVTFYRHNVRSEFHDSLHRDSGNQFADTISKAYYAGLEKKGFRRNRLFLTVCFRPFSKLDDSKRKKMSSAEQESELDNALSDMRDHWRTINSQMSRFTSTALGIFEENGMVFSEQLSFYEYLLTHKWRKVRVTNSRACDVMGNASLYFKGNAGQADHIDGTSYFQCLEIKEYSRESATGLMDALLYAPCDYVMTQSYTCMGRAEARNYVNSTLKRLSSSGDDAVSQRMDLVVLLDLLASGIVGVGKHHYSLMVYGDNLDELAENVGEMANCLNNVGLTPVASTLSLAPTYLSQLPGNYTLRPRLGGIDSQCFAELSCLHNFFPGKRDNAPWGEALAVFPTPSMDAYYLNLHNTLWGQNDFNEKAPFSTSVIGTNGSGKTVIANLTNNLQQKYGRPESFSPSAPVKRFTSVYFDKDEGARINIAALQGRYFRLRTGEPTGFNPFMLPANKRNVAMTKQLMKLLCTRNNAPFTERDEQRLYKAVDRVFFVLEPKNRVFGVTRLLENLSEPATQEAQENGLVIRLKKWAKGGEFGWIFDNENDTFDISECDNFGIDGTEFLDNADICSPISFYLLYRVTSLLDGRRLVIYMDEFWKWINDEVFNDFAYNKLKTIRKLNGCVIPLTQSPAEILSNPIAPAVIEQCATQIFSANPNATREHYVEGLKVPEEVFEVIKNLDPMRRQYVVIKNQFRRGDIKKFSALITLDLSGMATYLKVLSGSADNMPVFESVYREGMKPDEWLPAYLEKAM
ncbi:VirB3 family type IV secretion system protein [Pantoea ananatis]|uniref:VirB4 family type IV secretion/conjugal transfer ATPase n=1 Tax=Pantoea ananas TaxID=553 RepID=UPI001B300ADC|nr:VirB3 family type IV secretion system protein [Pantoea ananatis]